MAAPSRGRKSELTDERLTIEDTYQDAAHNATDGASARAIALRGRVRPGGDRARGRRHRRRRRRPERGGMPIIRDTEIEQLLRDYAKPILRVAGLAKQNVQVVVINDRAFNAFVMDGRHIFVNAGALFDAKTPNEIIGVLAHETGHLAGGHLSRMREELARAQTASIVGHAARRRRHGGGRARRQRRRRCRRRRDHGAAVGDPALAARLRAHPGRPGRPRRREIPQRDRTSRRAACSNCSSG